MQLLLPTVVNSIEMQTDGKGDDRACPKDALYGTLEACFSADIIDWERSKLVLDTNKS
jgi:hypothetical protein